MKWATPNSFFEVVSDNIEEVSVMGSGESEGS